MQLLGERAALVQGNHSAREQPDQRVTGQFFTSATTQERHRAGVSHRHALTASPLFGRVFVVAAGDVSVSTDLDWLVSDLKSALMANEGRIAASESDLINPKEQVRAVLRSAIERLRSENASTSQSGLAQELAWLQAALIDLAAFVPDEEARLVQQATESGVELDGAGGARAMELRKQIRARKGTEIAWLRGDDPKRWWYEAVDERPIGFGRDLLTTVEVGQDAQASSLITFIILALSSFSAWLMVRVSRGHVQSRVWWFLVGDALAVLLLASVPWTMRRRFGPESRLAGVGLVVFGIFVPIAAPILGVIFWFHAG